MKAPSGSPAAVEASTVARTEHREERSERGDSVLRARPALRRAAPLVAARRALSEASAVARTVLGQDGPERGDSVSWARLALRRVAPVGGARAAREVAKWAAGVARWI